MKRYKAKEAEERGELTIGLLRPKVKSTLCDLQGYLVSESRVISRTTSGKHYRMPEMLAIVLGVEVVDIAGAHITVPPTVLAEVGETLTKLSGYVRTYEYVDIEGIGAAKALRQHLISGRLMIEQGL